MKTFNLPDPGEGLVEAEIVQWLVAPGDRVEVNDVLVEIETSKSLVELPSPFAGVVAELLVGEGDMVNVGAPIIRIDDASGETVPGGETAPDAAEQSVAAEPAEAAPEPPRREAAPTRSGNVLVGYGTAGSAVTRRPRKGMDVARGPESEQVQSAYDTTQPVGHPVDEVTPGRPVTDEPVAPSLPDPGEVPPRRQGGPAAQAKPVVRRLARDLGVDLGSVVGTGPAGQVTATDVAAAAAGNAGRKAGGSLRRIPLRGVRRRMVQSMTASLQVPQSSVWMEVDVTDTVDLIESLKGRREFAGLRVSPILVLAKAVTLAITRHPEINSRLDLDRQEIVVNDDVNLGVAAATQRGLVVPNIKKAQDLNLVQLAEAMNDLVGKAREGRITPADSTNGTFTITNIGVFGAQAGTPILNPNESAIMLLGTIVRKPWVVGAGDDERVEIRSVCTLTLSIDHRVLDGELASRFLGDVARILERPGLAMLY